MQQCEPGALDVVVFTGRNATVQTYHIVSGTLLFQPARTSNLRVALARQACVNHYLWVVAGREVEINMSTYPTEAQGTFKNSIGVVGVASVGSTNGPSEFTLRLPIVIAQRRAGQPA